MPDAADPERVIADPLRFKQKLRIGEDAYAILRARKTLASLWESGGAGWTGIGAAQSTWVASTFFAPAAPTGVLAWFGLAAPAAAVTPIGWVVVAGLVASGGYYGVTRWLAGGPSSFVDTIPKFINTPIDLLGAGLFDLTAPLALRVALADGHLDPRESEVIADHFVRDWGYDPAYVEAALAVAGKNLGSARLSGLAEALVQFQRGNPDCNASEMRVELVQFLREIVAADGTVAVREERAIRAIEGSLAAADALVSRKLARRVRSTAGALRRATGDVADKTGTVLGAATAGVRATLGAAATAIAEINSKSRR